MLDKLNLFLLELYQEKQNKKTMDITDRQALIILAFVMGAMVFVKAIENRTKVEMYERQFPHLSQPSLIIVK